MIVPTAADELRKMVLDIAKTCAKERLSVWAGASLLAESILNKFNIELKG